MHDHDTSRRWWALYRDGRPVLFDDDPGVGWLEDRRAFYAEGWPERRWTVGPA